MKNPRALTLITLIFLAALSRLIPHPWNVAPITAMALFSGSHFRSKVWAFSVPLLAMLMSDAWLGFYSTVWSTYLAFALIVLIGFWIGENRTILRIAVGTLTGSVVFFIVTNLAVWGFSGMYARNTQGLGQCFALAIPFFRNTVLGDMVYSAAMFGSFALAAHRVPALKLSSAQAR